MEGYAWLEKGDWNHLKVEYKYVDTLTMQNPPEQWRWIEDSFEGTRIK